MNLHDCFDVVLRHDVECSFRPQRKNSSWRHYLKCLHHIKLRSLGARLSPSQWRGENCSWALRADLNSPGAPQEFLGAFLLDRNRNGPVESPRCGITSFFRGPHRHRRNWEYGAPVRFCVPPAQLNHSRVPRSYSSTLVPIYGLSEAAHESRAGVATTRGRVHR